MAKTAQTGFAELARFAYDQFGLDLGEGKQGLVLSRLSKKMREHGLTSLSEYCSWVQADNTGEALVSMIDALTTNHTSFFRENQHFDFLRRTVIPGWKNRSDVRLWCAAASTGEEPYSIAMTLLDAAGPAASAYRIYATDISTKVLATAVKAMYRQEVLPNPLEPWMKRFLLRGKGSSEGWYCMRPEVRQMVEFDRLNLVKQLPQLPKFSVIFCRNVMIYFDRPTQEQVVNSLAGCLEPGGYLFTGHSESLSGVKHSLDYVMPATYRKKGGA